MRIRKAMRKKRIMMPVYREEKNRPEPVNRPDRQI